MESKRSFLRLDLFVFIVGVLFLYSTTAFAATLHVRPGYYSTIQSAIDVASDGDTVLVADGTYTGVGNKNLDFRGKAITLKSDNGPENCIIDCGNDGRGFRFHSGESGGSTVSGFTITNSQISAWGGGICCDFSSSPTITNCIITGNRASYGGGISCNESSPTITDCTINVNTADHYGGGICCDFFSSPTIMNCTITLNTATARGGGVFCGSSTSPTITNCTITENTAKNEGGGGIYLWGTTSPSITNCTISGNTTNDRGGGILCSYYSPTITNCTIAENAAVDKGGGIYCYKSSPTITNCTITGNTADTGSGIFCEENSFAISTNCILWRDTPNEIDSFKSFPTFTHSDIQNGYSGEGNIDADPLFVDAENADYHLMALSPCIDAGTSEGAPDSDIDGIPRPQGAGYDMGAHEYVTGNQKGDINVDRLVNLADPILALQILLGMNPCEVPADYKSSGVDVNGDERVGLEEAIYALQVISGLRSPQ